MWENVQAVLNIHLPAARTPEETHAQIQVVRISFSDHNSDCSFESQVYFVTVDKKSKAVSLSHAKDNKVAFIFSHILSPLSGVLDIMMRHKRPVKTTYEFLLSPMPHWLN